MDTELTEEFIETCRSIAHNRSLLYQFFSIAFRYPYDDVIMELSKEENLSLIKKFEETYLVIPSTAEIIDRFKGIINSIDNPNELQIEYSRLFIGPFKLPSPPYESVYREGSKGQVMGDSTIDVKRLYQEEGLGISGSIHDLPDHILAELEFMSYLSEKEASEWQDKLEKQDYYIKKQDIFLTEHLIKWIPQFSQAIYTESKEEFYRLLAKLINIFVGMDYDYIKALTNSLNMRGQ